MKPCIIIILLLQLNTLLLAQEWSLDSCLNYALQHNKEILIQKQSIKTNDLQNKAAWTELIPEIEGVAGIDYYWKIPVQVFPGELVGQQEGSFVPVRMGTPWMGNYGVQANLKIADPQVWQKIKLTKLQEQAKLAETISLENTLEKNIRMAYYAVQLQQKQSEIYSNRYENHKEIHLLISKQYDKGLIDKIALNQSQNILNDREAGHSKALSTFELALLDLKFWMGFPLEATLKTTELSEFNEIENLESEPFSPTLLPQYELRKSNIQIAYQKYKSSIAQLYPKLHFSGGYRNLGFGNSIDFVTQSDWFGVGNISAQLSVPLFSLSKMVFSPKAEKNNAKIAELEFENYLERQEQSYLQLKAKLKEANKSMQIQKNNLALAQENEKLSQKKIEKGIIDMTQLKQIQQDLSLAQEKLYNAELNYYTHFVELNYLQNK